MSTRSNIRIIDGMGDILLYKHHDGYPENMIPFLKNYMSSDSAESTATRLIKCTECKVSVCIHGDIEWFYKVYLTTKEIKIFKVDSEGVQNLERTEKLEVK